MNNNDIEYVKTLKGEERYDLFLDVVAEEREVWILVNKNQEFLKIASDDSDDEILPVWPLEALALEYSQNTEEALTPKSVSLPDFFMKWVAGLERDGLSVGVFPGPADDVWVMTPAEVKNDLQDALSSSF
jgi:hypothetical protein